MDAEAVVYYEDLETQFGITYSRTHIKKLEKAGKFPLRIKPGETRGSRFWYLRRLVVEYVKGTWKP